MTGRPGKTILRRLWRVALVLAAGLLAGRLEAAQTPPTPLVGDAGCIDFWVISTRHLPTYANPAAALNQLAVWHREPSGWIAYRYEAFLAAIDTDVPVCFYLNGIFTSVGSATADAQKLFANMGAGLPPFRGVHWLWPSDFERGVAPREQVNHALVRSQVESFYLAATIQSLRNTPAVNMVGHSFGCQIAADALARLGRCRGAEGALCGSHPMRIGAVLIAPTIPPASLLAGGQFEAALHLVDRLLVTHNRDDLALHIYEQIQERPALGVSGLPVVMGGRPAKVMQVDAGPAVRFRHTAATYFDSPLVVAWLRGFFAG